MSSPLPFIPEDRWISKEEILSLTPVQIFLLEKYFSKEFNPSLSRNRYQYLDNVKDVIYQIFNRLNDGDIVLAPGDSPSKLVQTIRVVYSESVRYPDGSVKTIRFLNFPLSGISSWVDRGLLDSYLRKILEENNVQDLNRIKYLDYSAQGGSYLNIASSLQRIFSSDIVVPMINLSELQSKGPLDEIFDVSEISRSRCQPNFNLYQTRPYNLLRCNVVVTVLSLYLMNRL